MLMEQVKKSWKFLIILAILGGLFGTYPYVVARVSAGGSWQGVVPELMGDSLYYMTRANTAIHAQVMGNPYYATTYDVPSPSFSFADTITGIPYAFFSPVTAAVSDAFFWNALFALLLGGLLFWLGYAYSTIIVSWLIVASSIFSLMLRATNMQTIFPFFLLFFLLFLWTLHRDSSKSVGKHTPLLLGLFAGFAPYLHTFLFQIIAASLFIGVTLTLLLRRMRLFRSLATSIAVMIVCNIPYFVYFNGISDFPAFGETMNYFNGIRSHMPSPEVYFYGRWLVLLFVWSFVLWFNKMRETGKRTVVLEEGTSVPSVEDVVLTMATVSLGTLGVMMQNVITGVDIATVSHANYFVQILLPLGLILLIRPTIQVLLAKGVYVRKIILLLCVLVVLIKVAAILPAQFPNPAVYRSESAGPQFVKPAGNPQYIMPVLTALRSLSRTHVIAAPEQLSDYIPLYTGQHVLFNLHGIIFSVGAVENDERLLTSKLGQPLTKEDITQVFNDSLGQGADTEVMARNKLARKLCTAVFHSPRCSTLVTARFFSDSEVFDRSRWFDFYQTVIRPHLTQYLRLYNVSEVVIDQRLPVPEFLHGQTPWYTDQYYAIYDITSLVK